MYQAQIFCILQSSLLLSDVCKDHHYFVFTNVKSNIFMSKKTATVGFWWKHIIIYTASRCCVYLHLK